MPTGKAPERPLPVVARDLVNDVQSLVSQEIGLAKAEVSETVGKAAKAAALFAVAGILALYLLGFALSFVARLLDVWLPAWAAWLVVVLFILVLIALLGWLGYRMLPREAPGSAAKAELAATKLVVRERVEGLKSTFATPQDDPFATPGDQQHG